MTNTAPENEEGSPKDRGPGLGELISSTLWAALGVQKRKNLEKDFGHSSALPYIIAGIVFTTVFMLSLIGIVSWVLND